MKIQALKNTIPEIKKKKITERLTGWKFQRPLT